VKRKEEIEAIRHRWEECMKHCHDPYAYDPREIEAVRIFHAGATEDVAFLLSVLVECPEKQSIRQERHFGCDVWVNPNIEGLREKECLCFNCGGMENCQIAKKFFKLCVKEHLAMAITRCLHWTPLPAKEAKLVAHHDDPPCTVRLVNDSCPKCNVTPDLQSVALYLYCPLCDLPLKDSLECPKCGQTFKRPGS